MLDAASFDRTYAYEYDGNGNITKITYGGQSIRYTYDSQNQLIREDNQAAGKTWVWIYDGAGNITGKSEHPYTTGTPAITYGTKNYSYGQGYTWGDLLTSYGSKTITYDAIGNPLSDGTWTYTWSQGRQLSRMSSGSSFWNFTYDADGMRTGRSNTGTVYTYTYNGSQLVRMNSTSANMRFTYGADGAPLTISYGGTIYYYVTNLQGDVVAILNSSGVMVVEYTYDAWGRLLSTTGSMANTLGLHNPLRYRGYVYDRETGLYYLQSRYYNPEWGRFINADGLVSTVQGLIGYNMFAYCGNNPVNRIDYTGRFWSEIWEFAKTAVTEIGKAMGLMSPAYAGCGGLAVADGALPFTDMVAVAGAALLTVAAIGYGIYQAAQAPATSFSKAEEKIEAIVIPMKPDNPVVFPVDPDTFNPVELVKVPRVGT